MSRPILVVEGALLAWVVLAISVAALGLWSARSSPGGGPSRPQSWGVVAVTVFGSAWLSSSQQPLIRMVMVIVPLLWAMKTVVASTSPPLPRTGAVVFALLWPGMRTAPFMRRSRTEHSGAWKEAGWAALFLTLGLVELGALHRWARAGGDPHLAALMALVGLSLVLHFGLIRGLRSALMATGYRPGPLFVLPLLAPDLRTFWGRRWNLAFRDMISSAAYKPLVRRWANKAWGAPAAMTLAFLLSGLLHEAAITLPAGAGYGGPLLYFGIQAGLVTIESRPWMSVRLGASRVFARSWVMAGLLLPLPLLFCAAFTEGVVLPLVTLVGGSPPG